jgi:hypothetical protein
MAILDDVKPATGGQAGKEALGGFLKRMKPASVLFGARSGGIGSSASAGGTSKSVLPLDGIAASSLPEASRSRSRAVSAARSRSIGHLNFRSAPALTRAARRGQGVAREDFWSARLVDAY